MCGLSACTAPRWVLPPTNMRLAVPNSAPLPHNAVHSYSCLPQKAAGGEGRTPEEAEQFQLMLNAIADLYLTARVLILLDTSYAGRFWTMMEAWCSMLTTSAEGVRDSTEEERRFTIMCIHNAEEEFDRPKLIKQLKSKTPDEVYKILDSPDVNMTNMKDKDLMLPVIKQMDEHVKEVMLSAQLSC